MDARRAAATCSASRSTCGTSRERFSDDVIDDFVAEYAAGRTPNPCMRCNERIKFAALLEKALALGFDAVAPGTTPTIRSDDRTAIASCTAPPPGPRTSRYVLGVLTTRAARARDVPARGDAVEGRGARRGRGARAVGRGEAGQPRHLLHPRRRHPRLAGRQGRRGGRRDPRPRRHAGSAPIRAPRPSRSGQRKGLNIGFPHRDGQPAVRARGASEDQRGVVGPREALAIAELAGSRFSWAGRPPRIADDGFACEVQVRAHADPVPAFARVTADGELHHPRRRPARRCRPRPDRRRLRRHPRARPVHDRPHRHRGPRRPRLTSGGEGSHMSVPYGVSRSIATPHPGRGCRAPGIG